jgi:hypothetical protein
MLIKKLLNINTLCILICLFVFNANVFSDEVSDDKGISENTNKVPERIASPVVRSFLESESITVYTDEDEFLSAISGHSSFSEGFESSDWDPSRSGAPSITSQGLTWTASDLVKTGVGWARTGGYGVYDSFGDPDTLYIDSAEVLFGVGGWFRSTTASTIIINISGIGDVAELTLTSDHQFLGIINTDGFDEFMFYTTIGHWGADDLTVALAGQVNPPTIDIEVIPNPATIGGTLDVLLDLDNPGDAFTGKIVLCAIIDGDVISLLSVVTPIEAGYSETDYPLFSHNNLPELPPTIGLLCVLFDDETGELLAWDIEVVEIVDISN